MALEAAQTIQHYLQGIMTQKSTATVVLATGHSQLQFLEALITLGDLDWSKIILFHLDEYLGITPEHKASFRTYLKQRVESRVHPGKFHYIEGDTLDPLAECDRYTKLLQAQPIDLCCLGIGENGHLAFNEPNVARFDDPYSVKLVKLASKTRLAQVKQGHFFDLEHVPQYAITLTLPTICSAQKLLCLAPGANKASIVETLLTGPVIDTCPASILRQHADASLWLDSQSASLLKPET